MTISKIGEGPYRETVSRSNHEHKFCEFQDANKTLQFAWCTDCGALCIPDKLWVLSENHMMRKLVQEEIPGGIWYLPKD